MKIEKAPSNIRTLAACLWFIPALIFSYLFQNRAELFFSRNNLHIHFIQQFWCRLFRIALRKNFYCSFHSSMYCQLLLFYLTVSI